jgi:hypothetical protein
MNLGPWYYVVAGYLGIVFLWAPAEWAIRWLFAAMHPTDKDPL